MGECSKVKYAAEVALLSLATLVQVATIIISGFAGASDQGKFGFENTTGEVSANYTTQITPAGYTFSIWGVIYAWQMLWLLYAWTFVCRCNAKRTITLWVYDGFALVNAINISWVYLWGNFHLVPSAVLLIAINFVFCGTICVFVRHFYRIQYEAKWYDRWLTRILVLNGLLFYNTWTTIASLINLAAVLQYKAGDEWLVGTNAATISLSFLVGALVFYFVLENTFGDRYLRYVFSVYPVVIWALIGVLANLWGESFEENTYIYPFVIAVLCLTGILALVRVVLFVLFSVYRKQRGNSEYRSI